MKNISPTSHWKEARSYLPCDPACQHFPLKKAFHFISLPILLRWLDPLGKDLGTAFQNTLKITIRLANRVRTRFPRNSQINDRILKLLHSWLARFPIFTLPYEKISVRYSFLSSKWKIYNISFKQIIYIHSSLCSFLIRINIIYSSNKHILHFKRQTIVLLRLSMFVQRGYISILTKSLIKCVSM